MEVLCTLKWNCQALMPTHLRCSNSFSVTVLSFFFYSFPIYVMWMHHMSLRIHVSHENIIKLENKLSIETLKDINMIVCRCQYLLTNQFKSRSKIIQASTPISFSLKIFLQWSFTVKPRSPNIKRENTHLGPKMSHSLLTTRSNWVPFTNATSFDSSFPDIK